MKKPRKHGNMTKREHDIFVNGLRAFLRLDPLCNNGDKSREKYYEGGKANTLGMRSYVDPSHADGQVPARRSL